jgi:hypothetical protein
MMRRPESSYEHKWYPYKGSGNKSHQAWWLKTHGWRACGVTPGCMSDPRNKTMVTEAAAQRRFEKWCDIPFSKKGNYARALYWRARPEQAKKICGVK